MNLVQHFRNRIQNLEEHRDRDRTGSPFYPALSPDTIRFINHNISVNRELLHLVENDPKYTTLTTIFPEILGEVY